MLEQARGAVKSVVFDACRNELQLPTRDANKGLHPVVVQQGFFVAFASAPGRVASDRGDGSGPYAAALSRELDKPGLDHLNLFPNIKETVINATGGAQHPWEANGLARRIYLTGEPTTTAHIALWESIRVVGDVPALQRYLERYPKGLFATTAVRLIERLNEDETMRVRDVAERKARDAKLSADLTTALDEARQARQAFAAAEAHRHAAERASREAANASAQSTHEQLRASFEALAAAEAKRTETEPRLAALESAEQLRRSAKATTQSDDSAAARRQAMFDDALRDYAKESRRRTEVRLWGYINIDRQCQVLPLPKIEVARSPKHGNLIIRDEPSEFSVGALPGYDACRGTKAMTRAVYSLVHENERETKESDGLALKLRYERPALVRLDEFVVDLDARTAVRSRITRNP